jgi:predicted amidohydrolase
MGPGIATVDPASARARPERPLQLAVLQTDAELGRIEANVARLAGRIAGADLVLTPELSLTGYVLRDRVHDVALPLNVGSSPPALLSPLAGGQAQLIAGLVELGADGIPYNCAAVLGGGLVRHAHRKIHLPTYGMFEEGRWFGRGRTVDLFDLPGGWRAAILVCEDLWHPGLVYLAAAAGADLLLVLSAAAGRGVLDAPPDAPFASQTAWKEMTRVAARSHGVFVALANRCGVESGLTFAGGSRVVGPDGTVLAEASAFEEERLEVVLEPDALQRARTPFAHWRDEDPALLAHGLARLGIRA